jgi:hypothetical protein
VREFVLFVTIVAILPIVASANQESIVNKQDTDRIFSFNRAQWESYARELTYPPGWKLQLNPVDTGTGLMALDLERGMGLSVQPLFMDEESPPLMLNVGSYYPAGTFPTFSDDLRRRMEASASADLGIAYSVSISFDRMSPFGTAFDVVEIMIQQASPEPKSTD